ncbi:hypothetical protein FACS1894219_11770 [Clostridia bacterium]|nr:hypothetical protein FACS1894219_11770 [Clostridia bacterium]
MSELYVPVISRTTQIIINKTIYYVTSVFNKNARETAEQKFIHLIADRLSAKINSSEFVGNTAHIDLHLSD